MTSLEARLRAANPVPDSRAAMDDATYQAVLARAERSRDSVRWRPGQQHRRQQWYFAAATLLVALTLGGAVTWLGTRPTGVVAVASLERELANTYIDARADRDIGTVLELLAPGAGVEEYPVVRDLTELPAAFVYLDLVEQQLIDPNCEASQASPGTVICSYRLTDRIVERAGAGPIPGELRLTIDGGRIVAVDNALDMAAYQSATEGWTLWLDQNQAGGPDRLYRWTFQLDSIIPSPRLDALEEFRNAVERYDGSS